MTNITDIPWEARGVSLHTHAWAVKTKGGGRAAPPEKRGENIQIPFTIGRRSTRKVRDQRVLPLPMWIAPVQPDGSDHPTLNPRQMIDKNWRYLRDLMDVKGQFELTKRWYKDDGSIGVAVAMAELLEAPEPTYSGEDLITDVTFSLTLADPYFYGDPVVAALGSTIQVEGDAETSRVTLSLDGPGRAVFDDGNWVEFTGSGAVTIDIRSGLATQGANYVNGQVNRNPDFPEWPELVAGENTLSGSASGTITYEPAFK